MRGTPVRWAPHWYRPNRSGRPRSAARSRPHCPDPSHRRRLRLPAPPRPGRHALCSGADTADPMGGARPARLPPVSRPDHCAAPVPVRAPALAPDSMPRSGRPTRRRRSDSQGSQDPSCRPPRPAARRARAAGRARTVRPAGSRARSRPRRCGARPHPMPQPPRRPFRRRPPQRSPSRRSPLRRSPLRRSPPRRSPPQRHPAQRRPPRRSPSSGCRWTSPCHYAAAWSSRRLRSVWRRPARGPASRRPQRHLVPRGATRPGRTARSGRVPPTGRRCTRRRRRCSPRAAPVLPARPRCRARTLIHQARQTCDDSCQACPVRCQEARP